MAVTENFILVIATLFACLIEYWLVALQRSFGPVLQKGFKKEIFEIFFLFLSFYSFDLQGSSPKVNISHRQTPNILKKKKKKKKILETLVRHPRKQSQNNQWETFLRITPFSKTTFKHLRKTIRIKISTRLIIYAKRVCQKTCV